ncbi:MAG: hypothetical protein AAB433_12255 [Nitrospirota bacterium]
MVQAREALITQQIEVKRTGIARVSMQQWLVRADCMVVDPAVLHIERQ